MSYTHSTGFNDLEILKFSWEINVRFFHVSVLVIEMVKVMHYLHHRPSFGLGNKPQHEQAAGDGVRHENQEAELAKAVLGGKT